MTNPPDWIKLQYIPDNVRLSVVSDSISRSDCRITTILAEYPIKLHYDLLLDRNLNISPAIKTRRVSSVITSTYFDSIIIHFSQSNNELKQELAYKLAKCLYDSIPISRSGLAGEWHLPFVEGVVDNNTPIKELTDKIKLSCYRILEQCSDGENEKSFLSDEIKALCLRDFHNKVITHCQWDIFGHIAKALKDNTKVATLKGWQSYADVFCDDYKPLTSFQLNLIIKDYESAREKK